MIAKKGEVRGSEKKSKVQVRGGTVPSTCGRCGASARRRHYRRGCVCVCLCFGLPSAGGDARCVTGIRRAANGERLPQPGRE